MLYLLIRFEYRTILAADTSGLGVQVSSGRERRLPTPVVGGVAWSSSGLSVVVAIGQVCRCLQGRAWAGPGYS